MKGWARAIHRGGRGAAAPDGGRRDITWAPTEAARGGDDSDGPGGNQSSRRDYTSSGHGGDGDPPTTTTATQADGGRVAAAAGLPTASADCAGTCWLDGVDLGFSQFTKHIYSAAAPTDSPTVLHHRNTSFIYDQHKRLILTKRSNHKDKHTKRSKQGCRSIPQNCKKGMY